MNLDVDRPVMTGAFVVDRGSADDGQARRHGGRFPAHSLFSR